ncbi:cytochrome P450 [Vararia minispora EC-137]|uniref:Cytochrome P450 n=1 Tax=Vararia minispora EC-137 TaxID=1314806 RepID=A0ACB8QPS7_9AGAM|nr:cytochrome P450 [Vararia minispora EC-137]
MLSPALSPSTHKRWIEQYGRNVRIQGLHPWDQRLLPLDPTTLHHIMKHTDIYEKPAISRRFISRFIGVGMLSAEGAVHRRQRRVATPAFSVQNLRALVPLVFNLSEQMKDRWLALAAEKAAEGRQEKGMVLDVANWMARATFDVIGLAGFDYHFNAIQHETDELFVAYRDMFEIGLSQSQEARSLLGVVFPFLNKIFPDKRTRVIERQHEVIHRVAAQLIQDKTQRIQEGEVSGVKYEARDLLTLLLRSNAAVDLPSEQRISDEDILNNINTFLFAGSDTTSLALTWTFLLLAKHPEWQKRLRQELLEVDRPADVTEDVAQEVWKQINNLPILDKICRESLRLMAPLHSSLRVATADDILPVSKPFVGPDGKLYDHVTIARGTTVHIPVEGMNLDREYWGDDAWKFNPDRWDNLPEVVAMLPGLYANTLSFSAGPRSCIGQRFSMIEMKTFLYSIVRTFTFAEADERVVKSNVVLVRPYVSGKHQDGSRCPLLVTPYIPEED